MASHFYHPPKEHISWSILRATTAPPSRRVQAAGGRTDKPKFSIHPHGFIALVADTEGNCIGLDSMK